MIEYCLAALAPELARLDTLIDREIRRVRARYELSLDEYRGLYVSDAQVEALLRAGEPPPPPEAADAAEHVGSLRDNEGDSRWKQLACRLSLSEDERDLLLALLAPEIDPRYEPLYAYLNDDIARKWPTPELAARLFGRSRAHGIALRGLLAPGMSLVAGGVVEIIPASRDLPRFQRGWRVVAPVAAWLLGLPYADERLDGCVEAADRHPPLPAQFDEEWLGPALAPCVDGLRQEGPTPPLLLTAASAADAALAGRQLLTRADRPYHCLDLLALRAAPDPTGVLAALTLMQRIQGSAILAAPLDALADADGRPLEALALRLKTYTLRAPSVILAGGRGETWRRALGDLNTREIDLPEPDPGQRAALWRGLLDATDLEAKAIDALADRFVLGPARILGAAARATDAARLAGRTQPNAEDLNHAARITSLQSAGGTTCRIDTPFDLDDLVLPVKVKQRLRDVLSAIELRGRVLDEWGFARRVGGGRGIKVMFAGPSGTGKTMAAGILARSLQLDLQRIELAAVVSKYIGETEKNLDRAFAAARTANALLFIDEADALFGKRSEVKDAHDRYANVEIAYLLQKMEDHDGVVILATNLARNIDDAFSRRMQFVVEFPTPDVASRERLWRRMFPPEAPVQRDIDFNFLAKQFELAGGDIRNIALDAAFRAAQEEGSIDLKQVLKAIAREQVKRGKAPSMEEFREHFEQLREAHGSL